VNQFGDFSYTLATIRATLNKTHSSLNLDTFHITLVGGGIVERNQVLIAGDKLIAIPILSHKQTTTIQKKLKSKRGHGRSKLKDRLYGHKTLQ